MNRKSNSVTEERVKTLKSGFKNYLNSDYAHRKAKSTILSDAFYPLRHDIGIDFWNVLSGEESMQICREKILSFFANVKNYETAVQNASVYMYSIKILKKYVDSTFGDIDKFLELGNEELDKVELQNAIETQPNITIHSFGAIAPKPCFEEVNKYLSKWNNLENYSLQEKALDKLFFETYPKNSDMNDVLIKVASLNDFYNTNIYYPFKVAKHIVSLNIDDRLFSGDATLTNEIAKIEMDNGKNKFFYSFATKYCSHHKPLDFPIYDSYVDRMLRYFRDADHFYEFKNDDLRDYMSFRDILMSFKRAYELETFNFKEVDMYLWQLGQEMFPKKY